MQAFLFQKIWEQRRDEGQEQRHPALRPPRFASRETMAYMLDISTDTFDRLVADGQIEPAQTVGGLMRWPVERVFVRLEGFADEAHTDENAQDREDIRAGTARAFGRKAPR